MSSQTVHSSNSTTSLYSAGTDVSSSANGSTSTSTISQVDKKRSSSSGFVRGVLGLKNKSQDNDRTRKIAQVPHTSPITHDSTDLTFEKFERLAADKKLPNAVIISLNDKEGAPASKAHFLNQIEKKFGPQIASYFKLRAISKTYLTNNAPLTLATIRMALNQAKKIYSSIQSYVLKHSYISHQTASIMGYAHFLEEETKRGYEELQKLGLPSKHLAEGQRHALEFLLAAGINTAVGATATLGIMGALALAAHLDPTGAGMELVPMMFGADKTQHRLHDEDNHITILNSHALTTAWSAPSSALLADILATPHHALLYGGLGATGLGGSLIIDFTVPGRKIAEALPDTSTPLLAVGTSAAKLETATMLLNNITELQQTAVTAYNEAAASTSSTDTTESPATKTLLESQTKAQTWLEWLWQSDPIKSSSSSALRYPSGRNRLPI